MVLQTKINNWRIFICLILLLVPPTFFSLYVFPPSERLELSRQEQTIDNGNNKTTVAKVRVSDQSFSEPTFRNLLKDALQIPFNLKWYDICFVNKDTKVVYKTGFIDTNVNVTLNFNNNQSVFLIPYGQTQCTPYKFENDFTYQWIFQPSLNLSEMTKIKPEYIAINGTLIPSWSTTISPDTDAYATPEPKSLIVTYLIILIAWFGIVVLLKEVICLSLSVSR